MRNSMLVKRGVWAGTLPGASRLLLIKASCLENKIIYNLIFVYNTEILSMNHLLSIDFARYVIRNYCLRRRKVS